MIVMLFSPPEAPHSAACLSSRRTAQYVPPVASGQASGQPMTRPAERVRAD